MYKMYSFKCYILFLYLSCKFVTNSASTANLNQPLRLSKFGPIVGPPVLETKFCPAQTKEQIMFEEKTKKKCIFPHIYEKSESFKCVEQIKPKLHFDRKIGEEIKCYSYQYKICTIAYKTFTSPTELGIPLPYTDSLISTSSEMNSETDKNEDDELDELDEADEEDEEDNADEENEENEENEKKDKDANEAENMKENHSREEDDMVEFTPAKKPRTDIPDKTELMTENSKKDDEKPSSEKSPVENLMEEDLKAVAIEDDDYNVEQFTRNLLKLDHEFNLKIYQYCVLKRGNIRDTLHAAHHISSIPRNPVDSVENKQYTLKTIEAYKAENQKAALQKIFNKKDVAEEDYLIPQMLVPAKDIPDDFARGVNYRKRNTQPQWKSLSKTWEKINNYLWLVETTSMLKFHFITGAAGNTKVGEEEVRIGIDSSTRIPLYWWKNIKKGLKDNIMIIMHNTPKGIDPSTTKKLCDDKNVCESNGWFGIAEIANEDKNDSIYCCEVTEEIIGFVGLSGLTKVESITTLNMGGDVISDIMLQSINN